MAQNPTVIALDLDFTLARFRSGYGGIYDIAETYGISREVATQKLRAGIDSEKWFGFGRYADELFPDNFSQARALEKDFDRFFENDFCWYPGVMDILQAWRGQWIPLAVITAGSPELQTKKIQRLWFVFDDVHITDITKGKASAIEFLLGKYPDKRLLYVDDKESELQRISIVETIDFSRLSLFQISYDDTPKRESVPSGLSFRQIASLREIHG